jgi:predicted extracellular nuclease
VDAIAEAGGPTYSFAYIAPALNADGGSQVNSNIRNAFLYKADQVTLTSLTRLTDLNPAEADRFSGDDFANNRKALLWSSTIT